MLVLGMFAIAFVTDEGLAFAKGQPFGGGASQAVRAVRDALLGESAADRRTAAAIAKAGSGKASRASKDESDLDRAFGKKKEGRKSTPKKPLPSMSTPDFVEEERKPLPRDQVWENIAKKTDAELVSILKDAGGTFPDGEDISREELLDHMEELLERREEQRRAEKEKKSPEQARRARHKRELAGKGLLEIQAMFDDVHETYPADITEKAVRKLALEKGVLEKWDALDPTFKLERNTQIAQEKVTYAKHKAHEDLLKKEAATKAAEEARGITDIDKMAESMHGKDLHPWEYDWNKEDEADALERLSKTPLWNQMGPDQINNLMERIRMHPEILTRLESQGKPNLMADAIGAHGDTIDLDMARRAGANVITFEENLPKKPVSHRRDSSRNV